MKTVKRVLTIVAAAVLFAGCQDDSKKTAANAPSNSSLKQDDAAKTAMASETGKTKATVAPAAAGKYYEIERSGKTYVFSSADSLGAFMSTGTLPAATVEKTAFGPAGETVVFESGGGVEGGLMAEYAKSHPKK